MIPIPSSKTLPRMRAVAYLSLLVFITCLSTAHAQVIVRMQMNKSNYILNEPVTATISITNHAGKQLLLSGTAAKPWLNFQMSSSGRAVPSARRINYRPLAIPAGQTRSTVINLNASYSLGSMGNYTCTASVNMPGTTRNAFTSNREHFTITNGRTAWLQRAGIPKAPGEIREYKLITFTGNRALELYAQVSSANRHQHIATIPLGKVLNFRKPKGTLDGNNNMHALYQVQPNLFTHTAISPNGKVLYTKHHRRGASGDPRLMTFGDGSVKVAGSIPYDANKEAAQRKKIRNISERPPFIYRK